MTASERDRSRNCVNWSSFDRHTSVHADYTGLRLASLFLLKQDAFVHDLADLVENASNLSPPSPENQAVAEIGT